MVPLSTPFAPAGPSSSHCPITDVFMALPQPSQAPEGLHQAPHQGTDPSAKSSCSHFGDSFLAAGQTQDSQGGQMHLHRAQTAASASSLVAIFS